MGSLGNCCPSAMIDNFRDRKTEVLSRLMQEATANSVNRLLVVGCGSGFEAAVLSRALNAEVVGIDLQSNFNPAAEKVVDLRKMDATSLQFKDGAFDYVFSYHVIEHIPNFRKALYEIKRVLSEPGGFCIGTPNRSRMVGYIGSKDTGLRNKIVWNLNDWSARFKGKFKNEYGAHAGFSQKELYGELQKVFSRVEDITLKYYQQVYSNRLWLIDSLVKLNLSKILFPSVYFIAGK